MRAKKNCFSAELMHVRNFSQQTFACERLLLSRVNALPVEFGKLEPFAYQNLGVLLTRNYNKTEFTHARIVTELGLIMAERSSCRV